MILLRALTMITLLFFSSFSLADNTEQNIDTRLKRLSNELRCLVCQNSTLADSDAPLAQDLRNEIRKLMEQGKTDDEVVAFLVSRYGDFVTFRPPMNANTAFLWFGPFIMLAIGMVTLVVVLKRRTAIIEHQQDKTDK